ncbi:MAG: family 20 glycosylhydrolase [Muribaculaceae bacterium]|nr:family 20 glycosylhydrolase [Muribaculaceae bacterium]
MTYKSIAAALCTAVLFPAMATSPSVHWEVVDNYGSGRDTYYIQRLTIQNPSSLNKLCFNEFGRKMSTVNPSDTVYEIIPGYYCIESSRFADADTAVVVDIMTKGWIQSINYAPDGFHNVSVDGTVSAVPHTRASLVVEPHRRNYPGRDVMVYGDSVYRFNLTLDGAPELNPYDIVPSFKKVTLTGGTFTSDRPRQGRLIKHDNNEYYRITLPEGGAALVEAASPQALSMANFVLDEMLLGPNDGVLPAAVIEDYPDFHHRGMMLDVARNFYSTSEVKKLVRQMAKLRMNRLHFHVTDDEAWRLEIPGLPELTEVGARRGYTTDDRDFLAQLFAGDGNPESMEGTGNGYISREEFIDLLKYCDSLGIAVIPEIESPGHARAAVKAMEARYRRTGDDFYRLREDGDTSVYTSAQALHDNLMNPALPGPYRFMEKVFDEIDQMYKDAGVELLAIHIGGDEVPEGAWDGSPAAQKMCEELGISGRHLTQGEFGRRITKILKEKNIPMMGWQDVGVGYDDEFNAEVAPVTYGVNCWTAAAIPEQNKALRALRAGFPVVISNVDRFYMDMLYAQHPMELGLYWGGTVDEFVSLGGYPYDICPVDSTCKAQILGLQGTLFGETIRNNEIVESHLFPKSFGLAERTWNAYPTYDNAKFNKVVYSHLLPRLSVDGVNYHLRMPGIIVVDGMVKMNTAYPGGEIRYTLDGTEPDASSPVYNGSFPIPEGVTEIRARHYYDGKESVTSLLYL